jgi:hypothetical protein
MRQVESIVKLSFPNKENNLTNCQVEVKQPQTVIVDGKEKTKMVDVLVPRVRAYYNAPANVEELVVTVGGPENMDRFIDEIYGGYSHTHAKRVLAALDKTTPADKALQTYLAARVNFSFVDFLSQETKSERAEKAITINDKIAELSAQHRSGRINAVEFARLVEEALAGVR